MARRLFTLLSALSLLLFVATAALWVRSHRTTDELTYYVTRDEERRFESDFVALAADEGRLIVSWENSVSIPPPAWQPGQSDSVFDDGPRWVKPQVWGREAGWKYTAGAPGAYLPADADGAALPGHFGFAYRRDAWDGASGQGLYPQSDPSPGTLAARGLGRDTGSSQILVIPAWALFLLLVLAPCVRAITFLRRWRYWRERRGLCPACGYDLRATSGRCPECGTAAAGKEP